MLNSYLTSYEGSQYTGTVYVCVVNPKLQIFLYNTLGQKQTTQTFAWSEGLGLATIDFSGYPKGIYLLAVQQGVERKVFKVVKE